MSCSEISARNGRCFNRKLNNNNYTTRGYIDYQFVREE